MSETLIVRAEIAELARVGDWVESFGRRFGLRQSTLYAIHLCLEEAISNIVRYAFRDADDHDPRHREVRLSVEPMGNAIVLTIEDGGLPFNPLNVSPPAGPTSIEAISAGGWGIHLMKQFARSLSYQRQDNVNRLTLRF